MNKYVVVLAAGKGTRMKSSLYKVLHKVSGKPMVEHVIDNVSKLGVDEIVTVTGFGAEAVKDVLGNKSQYVLQEEQLGTGHAVDQAEEILGGKDGVTMVVCGDTPLIRAETIELLFNSHIENDSKATILTAIAPNPTGYGRVIRDEDGNVQKIVEQKDASVDELKVQEINTGTFCFDNKLLFEALKKVDNSNAQGEYYLTDVIELLKQDGHIVGAYCTDDFDETIGVNDRVVLSQAETILRARLNEMHMRNGVTLIDPATTYIESDAEIGPDTIIYPGTMITGKTIIGSECKIGPNSEIANSTIGNKTVVRQSVVAESKIGDETNIGPFAHIRPASDLGNNIRIGNFVEVKKSTIDNKTNVSHLSYIGDAKLGSEVNVGCGTITVNYDGKNKFQTVIEDGAFVGCNSNLMAPVTIGKNTIVAAGTTVTKDVPENDLAISRVTQVNKEGYAKKLRR